MREFKSGLISSDKLLKSRLFNRIKHRCFAGLKTLFTLAGLTLALALALTPVTAQAQSTDEGLSEGAVSSLLSQVQERPISLFLGLPVVTDGFEVFDPDGKGETFEITATNAQFAGQALGDLVFAGVADDHSLSLSLDLLPVAQSYWTDRPSVIDAEALTLEVSIDQRTANFERIALAGSNLRFADASDPEASFFGLDSLSLSIDDAEGQERLLADIDLQGAVFQIEGERLLDIESLSGAFQSPRARGKFLHEELNYGMTTSMLVLAGLIDPVLIVPDLLERWAPLFEQTPIDLDSSLTLGPVQLRRYNFAGNDIYVDLSGMTLESVFDAASNDSLARFDLGSGSVGLMAFGSDDTFELASFEGGRLDASTLQTAGTDSRFIAEIMRALAGDIRTAVAAGGEGDPLAALTPALIRHGAALLDGALEQLERTEQSLSLAGLSVAVSPEPGAPRVSLDEALLSSVVDYSGDQDVQETIFALRGLSGDVAGLGWGGRIGGFELRSVNSNVLTVFRDILSGLVVEQVSMGDGIRLALATYLPSLSVAITDVEVAGALPGGDAGFDVQLGKFGLGFETSNLASDRARLGLLLEQSGLNLDLRGDWDLDPTMLALFLGEGDAPGLLPQDIRLEAGIERIPMEQVLTIADTILLPVSDLTQAADLDIQALTMSGFALVSPFFSSPPSLVVAPSYVRGGLVGAEAAGEVVISPLAEPNFGEGQIDLRVTGLGALKQMVEGQMEALSGDDSDEARSTLDLLSQLVGLSMLMDSLGIPAEDEDALDFVIEVPLGAPINVNGYPVGGN